MNKKIVVLCLFLMSCMGVAAHADTIGPNCGSCLGSTYTLTYSPTGTANLYNVSLVVNTAGFTGPSTDLLNAIAIKIVPQTSDYTSIVPTSLPATFIGGIRTGGLNANGCSGAGDGFFCMPSSTLGVPVGAVGDVYTFSFLVGVDSAANLLTGNLASSVKALYVTSAGQQNGITSEDITLQPGRTPAVPEPSTFALMGTGLVGAALFGRKLIA